MEKKDFRIAVVTVSDRSYRNEREDKSGPELVKCFEENGYTVFQYMLVPDGKDGIKETLSTLSDEKKADLIVTTGGTGVAERDVTPEATMEVASRNVPGIAEAIRACSLAKTSHAMLSRGASVIRNKTLIVNFPGSPKACRESFEVIMEALPHALGLLRGEKLDS